MKLQLLANILGYAGLVPFVLFSIGAWITLPLVDNPHFILLTYAAVILSFMGAIHWGVAMSQQGDSAKIQLGTSVLPALLGWMALLIPVLYGYGLLIVCFSALCVADKYAADKGLVPGWYLPLRVGLTTIVVLCLIAAALAVFIS